MTSTIKYDFRGVSSNVLDYGTQASITPTRDGWLAVEWKETSVSPLAISYITCNGANIVSSSGIGYVNGTNVVSAPVKAGRTYGVAVYRGSITSAKVYY